jgi:hypothetical protein
MVNKDKIKNNFLAKKIACRASCPERLFLEG